MEITPKVRKPKLSFLYTSSSLFYISTKYYKNIPKGIQLTKRTQNQCIITVKITKGDNAKSKKGILLRNMSSGPVLHFYQVPSKYSNGYLSYSADTKSFSNKTKGNNSKVRKPKFSFLYATHHLVLFYISIKYHQNIPKGIQVIERTRSFTLTQTPTATGRGGGGERACNLITTKLQALFSHISKFLIGTEYLPLLDMSHCDASASRWGIFSIGNYWDLLLYAKRLHLDGEYSPKKNIEICFHNIS